MAMVLERMKKRGPLILLPFIFLSAAWRFLCREAGRLRLQYLYGMRIGVHCHIGSGIRFVYPGNIVLASRVSLAKNVRFWSEIENGKLVLKQGVSVARDCVLDFSGGLTVEENALLSEGVIVYTHDHGYDPRSKPTASPLTIGMNAWIGARAIILPSVNRIGAGALIGAGAVVTRDVPENHIYIGAAGRSIPKKKELEA